MKFKQYRLQILVDGMSLEECWEPLDNNNNHESSSYVRDEITQVKHESGTIHYVAVNVDYGTRFSVRFSAEDATKDQPIKAYLSVDGNWDFTYYQLTDEKFRKENGFWNKDRNKKYYFKFIQTTSSSDSIKLVNNNNINIINIDNEFSLKKSGGLGCVSVYFYRAKWVNHHCKVPNFNINHKSAEKKFKKFNKDISLYTGFDEEFHEQNDDIQIGVVNLKRISKKPIAELHIHYRDISYFINRGFTFPTLLTPKGDMIREDYFEDIIIKQRNEIIKLVQSNIISLKHFDQSDKEESILIKEKSLASIVEVSNKRSAYEDENQPSKKRIKNNSTVQSDNDNLLDNSKADISQSVTSQFINNVTKEKLMKSVDKGFAEDKILKNVELLCDKIKELKTSSIKSRNLELTPFIESNSSSRQVNNFSNAIIIEDSDDNDVPMYNKAPSLIVSNGDDSSNEKVKNSKVLQKQDQVICLSDDEEEIGNASLRSHEIKKRKKNKNYARHNSFSSDKIKMSKPVYDVIVLSD
ncbi:hypothetical protein C1645_822062 [Glomus cerebriforme]|uniref:Uncharacterized protein n=1 Tax=Glomus cerebriforme TaxID=658196 RepID=A0A397SZG3_9GLOM|nr:hypothetical protein C1645_822062 [Glomus cerebriforme]